MTTNWAGTVSPGNLRRDLEEIAGITAPDTGPGVTRLAITEYERRAHDLIAGRLEAIGMDVHVDAFGNTIGLLAGTEGDPDARPIVGTGSHLDSVPHGGRYDGIIGVVGAVEAARIVAEHPGPRPFDLVVSVWANEEGARFTQACNGSRAAAGWLRQADLDRLVDASGISMREAMLSCGLSPDALESARWSPERWVGFVELHCEQGRVLEEESAVLGIVDRVSSSSRFRVDFTGVASHSGGTPMGLRQDALMAAVEWMREGERLAREPASELRVTFGKLEVRPNSVTTVPGEVSVWVDVRDIVDERMDSTAQRLKKLAGQIAAERECSVASEQLARVGMTAFDPRVTEVIASCVADMGYPARRLYSGASHDAQIMAGIIPAGMIFVPSVGGISHAPEEATSLADIAVGTEALTRSLWQLGTVGLR